MKDVILRNARAEQYIYAAKKQFILDRVVSNSNAKMLVCHFSDIHTDWKRLDNIMELLAYYKPAFAVHTGDLVCYSADDSDVSEFYKAAEQSETPVYNCIGNHETYEGKASASNESSHERFIAPLKNICTDGHTAGFYYADIPNYGVRLIVLNNYENDRVDHFLARRYEMEQEQIDWLIQILQDCEKNNLAVIIASHEADEEIPPDSDKTGFCQRYEPHPWGIPVKHEHHIVADIIDAFQYGRSLKKTYTWSDSGRRVVVDCSFTKQSEFICHLNGHRHGDYVGYMPNHPSQLSMGMTCSGCFPEGYHNIGDEISDLPRTPDSISEDAVNFFVVDREKKEITLVRVGAYVNDLLEERLVARYRYGIEK